MKKLFQIGLLLLLATPVVAQKSSRPNPPKVLRTYDWKDLATQIPNSQIVSMDGMSVLKIENTNDTTLEISLLTITNASLLQKANTIELEMKYENVTAFNYDRKSYDKYFGLFEGIIEKFPPQAIGGDSSTNHQGFYFRGTQNWNKYSFTISHAPYDNQTAPNELKLKIWDQQNLPWIGTVYLRPIKLLGTAHSFDWWSEKQAGLIGGIGGSVIGCFGALIGVLASRGKARKFVLTLTKIFIVLGIFLLLTGAIAAATKQPYAVYYPLLLAGFILTIVFSVNLSSIQRRYDELEIRRMTSLDAS